MPDLDDEAVITAFLLGTLDEAEQTRLFDRLADDEAYFERVEAAEDDLILRWHRDKLTPEQRELFAKAYAAPARRARVEESLALLRVAEASVAAERAAERAAAHAAQPVVEHVAEHAGAARPADGQPVALLDRIAAWLSVPSLMPRWGVAAGAVAIVAALLTGLYFSSRRMPGDGGDGRTAGPPMVVAVTLTAIGEKGPPVDPAPSTAKGFDTVRLPRPASAVQLTVEPRVVPNGGALTADISSPDNGTVLQLGAPTVSRSTNGTALTVTVPARDLPDGDYLLTVRRAAPAGSSEVLSTQAFRVIRTTP
jgi:hypothetical protein